MAERKDNVELLNHLMNFSKHGALMQMFIMDALGKFAEHTASASDKELENPVAAASAWRGCAVELLEALNEYQGRNITIPTPRQDTDDGDGAQAEDS